MTTNITITYDGRPVFLYLYVSGWSTANYQNAYNVTFTCNGITKSQMDTPSGAPLMGIFYAHPIIKRSDDSTYPTDSHAACFIVRFYPSEIATFTPGTAYPFTFSATLP